MRDIDQLATDRVLKARGELILTRRFYGVLVSNVEPVLSRAHPTMATDGKRHFFNPDFIATLTQQELLTVQAHESEHDARHHGTRRSGRDAVKWNVACGYAINVDLVDQGFKLPTGALIDAKYRGMSAEDIYRSRELDEAAQKQQPDDHTEPDDEQDDGESDDASADHTEGEDEPADDENEEPSEDEPDSGDQENDMDGEHVDTGGASGDGDEPSDDTMPGAAGNGESDQDSPVHLEPQPHQVCGEVLDSVEDASEMADEDIKWERITREAATIAAARGELPGHVTREIERANNPTRNWRDELREFCEQGAQRIETWNRPNRRFAARRQILPSSQKDGISKAAIVIDTSGSIDELALQAVCNEVQGLMDDGVIDDVVVVYGDVRVTRVDEFSDGDQIEFDPRGGGGTNLKPLFQHVTENVEDASVLICFTALDNGDPGPEPHCPALFAVTGYPSRVRELIKNCPWGARGIDVGAH